MTERWERRERKLQARREQMPKHGVAYKTIIVPKIAQRANEMATKPPKRPAPTTGRLFLAVRRRRSQPLAPLATADHTRP